MLLMSELGLHVILFRCFTVLMCSNLHTVRLMCLRLYGVHLVAFSSRFTLFGESKRTHTHTHALRTQNIIIYFCGSGNGFLRPIFTRTFYSVAIVVYICVVCVVTTILERKGWRRYILSGVTKVTKCPRPIKIIMIIN